MPCSVRRGTNATFLIDFTAPRRVNTITTTVTATQWFVASAYPLPAQLQDGCAGLVRGSCPMVFNRVGTLRFPLPMRSNFFQTPTSVTFRVSQRSHDNSTLSCFDVDLRTTLF